MAASKPYPLQFTPQLIPRPWGGARLAKQLGKSDASSERFGESWELSDYPEARSRIANGERAGEFFGDVIRENPKAWLGLDTAPERFPVLVKYIDAEEALSIQVHPDDESVRPIGERGKSECWYIMDCAADAQIIYGMRENVSAGELRTAIEGGGATHEITARLNGLVRRCTIRPGAFLDVPPGVVHAILDKTLLCEIQQTSNATYRIWDWGREPKRPLHLDQAMRVARFGSGNAPDVIQTSDESGEIILTRNSHFTVRYLCVSAGEEKEITFGNLRRNAIVNVVGGSGSWRIEGTIAQETGSLPLGATWFFPPLSRPLVIRADSGQSLRLLLTNDEETK